jgi:OOP family OmpA-OmpF porin
MVSKILFFIAAALLMLSSGGLYAQDQGWYMGIGVGQSKAKQTASCSDLNGLLDPGFSCSLKDTDTGAKLFGGYQFNQYVAAEVSYVSLGNFKLSANGTITGIPATANASDKPSGFSIDAVGSYPITKEFAVLGRIGIFAWSLDDSSSVSAPGLALASSSVSNKPTGTNADFGIGVKYDFDRNMGARAEFQRFKSIGNETTGKSDVDLISASFVYRFR